MVTLWACRGCCPEVDKFAVCMVTVTEDARHVLLEKDVYENDGGKRR